MRMFPLLFAWRAMRAGTHEQSIAPMMLICFMGTALGAFSLALVVSIMQGFEKTTTQALQNVHPPVLMRAADQPLNYPKIRAVLEKEFPEVIASAPTCEQYVMVKDQDRQGLGTVLLLKGIDPHLESRVTTLEKTIRTPTAQQLGSILSGNRIIIGKKLAEQLELTIGDSLTIMYVPDSTGSRLAFEEGTVIVGGIMQTGIEEVDSSVAYAHKDFFNELFTQRGVCDIGLRIKSGTPEAPLIKKLAERFKLEVVSWRDLYPALVWALKLEKYATFAIIALISLVASMNIISLLFMHITQKRRDIAILIASGITTKTIRNIFLWIGLLIGTIGTICGLAIALGAGLFLKYCSCIQLPDVYYTSSLPIELSPWVFLAVFITDVLITLVATLIPLRNISRINCADVLRFEG